MRADSRRRWGWPRRLNSAAWLAAVGFAALSSGVAQADPPAGVVDPVRCAQDRTALQAVDAAIETLSGQRNLPQYAGPGATLYVARMKALTSSARTDAAAERVDCAAKPVVTPPPPSPAIAVLGPNFPNGVTSDAPDSAGLTVALAGDEAALYAVSLNAGVWKSTAGGPWVRLPHSPRYAHSIAVDPNNARHLAVGERAGDAIDPHADGAGLWESFDAGATWRYTFDPLTQAGCTSQAIPSLAFTPTSTLVLATTCGVGRKLPGAASVDFSGNATPDDPAGIRRITAVAVSETKIWARTETALLIPQADGSWKVRPIPYPAGYGHDEYALAAFDDAAYFPCCDDNTLPPTQCANLDDLVVYRADADTYAFLPKLKNGVPLLGCSGAGWGGSRFVKAFITRDGRSHRARRRLFYSSADEIYEASGFNRDGSVVSWTRPLAADPDSVHRDFWDFLLAPDGRKEWIANDGGVYGRTSQPVGAWVLQDAGLATHHAHTLFLGEANGPVRLAYPTSDNDAWFTTDTGWDHTYMGDVGWSAGDSANPNVAILVRRTHPCFVSTGPQTCANLTGFGHPLPGGQAVERAQLTNEDGRDGPEVFNIIQSLASETPGQFTLDALLLATLPLQYADTAGLHDVPGQLGLATGVVGGPTVLLRNPDFASTPDIDTAKGTGWSVFANNLPVGASRFWVAGGHAKPVVYVMTPPYTSSRLFKATGVRPTPFGPLTTWTLLNVRGTVLDPTPFPASGILDGSGTFGPVFVNPYNADELYVLTNAGVMVSENGGFSFKPDTALTQLIQGRGKYQLTGIFSGGDFATAKLGSRAVAMGTLANVSFYRGNPRIAVAASPFTGVFFKDEAGAWHDLSGILPQPVSSVSDARLDGANIYVSTEGAGVIEILDYRTLAKAKGIGGPSR